MRLAHELIANQRDIQFAFRHTMPPLGLGQDTPQPESVA
jgi:hypothetical protein